MEEARRDLLSASAHEFLNSVCALTSLKAGSVCVVADKWQG